MPLAPTPMRVHAGHCTTNLPLAPRAVPRATLPGWVPASKRCRAASTAPALSRTFPHCPSRLQGRGGHAAIPHGPPHARHGRAGSRRGRRRRHCCHCGRKHQHHVLSQRHRRQHPWRRQRQRQRCKWPRRWRRAVVLGASGRGVVFGRGRGGGAAGRGRGGGRGRRGAVPAAARGAAAGGAGHGHREMHGSLGNVAGVL
jgi:hypothetical protein